MDFSMTPYIFLTICLILTKMVLDVTSFSSFQSQEVRRILFQYFLACGEESFCDIPNLNFTNVPKISIHKLNSCPKCACDNACYTRRDCCPDVYFTNILSSCKSFVISSEEILTDFYRVISSCPYNASEYLKAACAKEYKDKDLLFYAPVTSNTTSLAYKNKFCAQCNGDEIYESWSWYIRCRRRVNFNFKSSYKDILETVEREECIVEYAPFQTSAERCNRRESNSYLIDKCNVSKTWTKWDPDVLKGCELGYENKYGVFKNVFCHLCNPPLHSKIENDVIDSCAARSDDSELMISCANYPALEAFGPFRNTFCHQCMKSKTKNNSFKEVSGSVEEYFDDGGFRYHIQINNFHEKFLKEIIEERLHRKDEAVQWSNSRHADDTISVVQDTDSYMIQVEKNHFVNLSNIVQTHFAKVPKMVCNEDLLPSNISLYATSGCSCDPMCVFTDFCNCCVDIALLNPSKCVNTKLMSPVDDKGSSYLVTEVCQNKGLDPKFYRVLYELCTQENTGLWTIPVHNKNSGITYRNIFCLLCNEEASITSVLAMISDRQAVWNVDIHCQKRIDHQYTNSINGMISSAKKANCEITLLPKDARKCVQPEKPIHTKCNETGHWMNFDSDIKWACENASNGALPIFAGSKNVFCSICNPADKPVGDVISTCNVTGNWFEYDYAIDMACQSLPYIQNQLIHPFKNDFCAFCNGYDVPHIPLSDEVCNARETIDGNYHGTQNDQSGREQTVISVVQNMPPKLSTKTERKQLEYDSINKIQRLVSCFPGRFLTEEGCTVLIPNSISLRYSLALSLEGFVQGNKNGISILQRTRELLYKHIKMILNIRAFDVEKTYFLSNRPCDVNTTAPVYVKILFFGILHFRRPINRIKVESELLKLHDGSSIATLEGNGFKFIFSHGRDSFHVPTILSSGVAVSNRCSITEQGLISYDEVQTMLFVNKLLICKQVTILKTEALYDERKFSVQILNRNVTLYNDQFYIDDNGDFKVCLKDFRNMKINTRTYKKHRNGSRKTELQLKVYILSVIFLVWILCV